MSQPKAGLLLLFAGLYDQIDPQEKNGYASFIEAVTRKINDHGIGTLVSPVCMTEGQTREAVGGFRREGACAVIVLFLAYHPSLESAGALAECGLPVVILDTTMCHDFGPGTDPDMITWCHGIHGVQDLCCVLRRMGKDYLLEAGHYIHSDVISRVAGCVRACHMAGCFRRSRVGIIGEPFAGMGDFALPFDAMESQTGIRVIPLDRDRALALESAIDPEAQQSQAVKMTGRYRIGEGVAGRLLDVASAGALALHRWAAEDRLDAVSFNFLDFNGDPGLSSIPFAGVCELMAGGLGYAGEGDVLTAALVAALMKVYPQSTFTEMFCPDWKGGTVLLSHMGEANPDILQNPALVKIPVPYTPNVLGGVMPAVAGAYRSGKGVLVNLAPGPGGRFSLILAPCELLDPGDGDRFGGCVRGWMKPGLPLEEFLKEYSLLGGTHHSCLCYGADVAVLRAFGAVSGWSVHVIGEPARP